MNMKQADNRSIFCRNIRFLRKQQSLTQKQLADIMDVSTATVRRMENNDPHVRVNGKILCKLANYFDLSVDWIMLMDLEEIWEDHAVFEQKEFT